MIERQVMSFPYFNVIPTPIAHRGFTYPEGVDNGLENSMAAFAAAIELGYKYVETDIHGSKDGVAVINHDETLDRTTDRKGRIRDMEWAEISQAKIRGSQPVARLDDLLAAWPDLRVNIHLKEDSAAIPVAQVIEKYSAHDRVGLTSFSTPRRKVCEAHLSRPVAAGAGTAEMLEVTAGAHLRDPELIRRALRTVDCVQILADVAPHHGHLNAQIVDREMVNVMHQAGKYVHAWTIDDPAEMNRLLDLGVDGIITNRADILKEVLIKRGQWK
jgi:glycerophosphoryl diester phosphodiesterase